jgi:putative addiction module component (TIGR02574 family)
MSLDQIASEALRLPPQQRAFLAESLWESLDDPFELSVAVNDETAITLALERDRQIEAGEVKAIPHDDMMAKLRR